MDILQVEETGKRKIKDTYPNLIFTTWDTVDRPRQVIVSDMTAFKFWIFYFEVTFYFDVFTKEILAYRIAARKGDRYQYINGFEDVKELLKGTCLRLSLMRLISSPLTDKEKFPARV